jgi:hypothetical protein
LKSWYEGLTSCCPGASPSIRDEAPQNGFEKFFFEIRRLKSKQDGYRSPTIRSLIWWTPKRGPHYSMQETVWAALGRERFPRSRDDDRYIIWPPDAEVVAKTTYRGAGGRDHGDIPLPELAGLAEVLRAEGLEEQEEIIRGMQEHFGLGRLAGSTRQRFEVASARILGQ